MQPTGFKICSEEGPCLTIVKPTGLLTQAPPHIDSLERRIKAYLKDRDDKPGRVYLGVPHRLDRPVSGIMVFAKHVRAAKRLSQQFQDRRVKKQYWACVEGTVTPEAGEWVDYMRKIPGQAQAEIVSADHPEARIGILRYQVVFQENQRSWLEIELETGRTHQIRLQASTRHHAILGDLRYGASAPFGPGSENERTRSIALHARQLSFFHPMNREPRTAIAPLPASWRQEELLPQQHPWSSGAFPPG